MTKKQKKIAAIFFTVISPFDIEGLLWALTLGDTRAWLAVSVGFWGFVIPFLAVAFWITYSQDES